MPNDLRVPFPELQGALERAFTALRLAPARAALAARLTAEADCDGVRTHGIARFARFAEMVRLGRIDPLAAPTCTQAFGALERWDGHRGPGNLAAHAATLRAMQLAEAHGLGGVALADTTHWQRGGTFGWLAAQAGCGLIAWTNTLPNLPPWGAITPALGNNPLVIAIPAGAASADGAPGPVVLDMALSQYSYGTLAAARERGAQLPFAGGFNAAGELTTDPAAIEASGRALPIGLWKGAGLSFALDVLAALLSAGRATHAIDPDPLAEAGQSQVFLAFSPAVLDTAAPTLRAAVDALHAAVPATPGNPARYPGEATLRRRAANLRDGVPLDAAAWSTVLQTAAAP